MKKVLAIVLSVMMVLCLVPFSAFAAEREITAPADSYVKYDRDEVYEGKYSDLSYDQIAGILLDWLDKEIAANTEDFNSFNLEVLEGVSVEVPLNINSLDGILSYSGYLSQLGGDFANLDTTALNGLSRANGDINFIFGIIKFVADNADTFAKVFAWEDGKTFDFGKVGEYILSLDPSVEENKKLQDFYNDYLIGNDIQKKFLDGIAAEMDYTPADGETADDIINNGILAKVAEICKAKGILSESAIATLKNEFDLRTTDIYTLIKSFVSLVQTDNEEKINMYYNFLLDNVLRTLLKTMFGYTPTIGEEVADATAVTAEFKAVYSDLVSLAALSETVYFRAADGNYYQFTLTADGAITSVKALTWTEQLELEPPTVTILTGADANTTVKEYRPTSEDYKQYIYSSYADEITAEGFSVEGTTVPEVYTSLMVDANAAPAMSDCFAVKVTQGETLISSVTVGFDEIEEMANTIALQKANEAVQAMVDGTTITAASVKSVDVAMSYKGWATDDEFIVEVTATATAKASVTAFGFTVDQDVDASSYITNPVATFVLDDLSGSLNIDSVTELLKLVDTDFAIDDSFIDFSANYDTYNGVIGQVNHILYGFADMIMTDDGMTRLALTDGGNEYLDGNMQKICTTVNDLLEQAKQVMNDEGLQDIIDEFGLNDILASVNGLSADALFGLDFSSVEALYVSVINMALDVLDDGENEIFEALNEAFEGADSLDKMAVALTDVILEKVCAAAPELINSLASQFGITVGTFSYSFDKTALSAVTGNAKNIILEKVADFALYAYKYVINDVLNAVANKVVTAANEYLVNDLGAVKFVCDLEKGATGEATLEAIIDSVLFYADGIIIGAGDIAENASVYDKASTLLNAIIPMGTLISNCYSDKFDCDLGKLADIIFGEALDGKLGNFLALFEAYDAEAENKKNDIAHDCSTTYALVKTFAKGINAMLPETVKLGICDDSDSYFKCYTSCDNIVAMASNAIKALETRKANLLPAVFELLRSSDLLQSMVTPCPHENTVDVNEVKATCVAGGFTAGVYCNDCEKYISGHAATGVDANAHGSNTEAVAAVKATCTSEGKTAGVKCLDCGNIISGCETEKKLDHSYTATVYAPTCTMDGYTEYVCACGDSYTSDTVAKTGHTDSDGNYVCDTCGEELEKPSENSGNFFDKILSFFRRIIDWFKNLFS